LSPSKFRFKIIKKCDADADADANANANERGTLSKWTCQTNWHVSWQKSKTNWVMSSPDARCQPGSVRLSSSYLISNNPIVHDVDGS